MSARDPRSHPRLPADFSVEDILAAPVEADDCRGNRDARQPEREVRAAVWELDFALQELDWLRQGGAHEAQLVQSIIAQLAYTACYVERFPVSAILLPEDLCDELADRFARLTEAIDVMPSPWSDHDDLREARLRLGTGLKLRGVNVL